MRTHINILHFGTKRGDVEIREDELATITDAELRKLKVSRKELHRLFTEGVEAMQSGNISWDRARPVADNRSRYGQATNWVVGIGYYAAGNGPAYKRRAS
jgi:hypothetical protein